MAKRSNTYFCENCGAEYAAWQGQCSMCKEWNTIVEQQISESVTQSIRMSAGSVSVAPQNLKTISKQIQSRITTGLEELDRVLGVESVQARSIAKKRSQSGLVSGSVVLLTGEPGVGKSTLLLQLALNLAGNDIITTYISAEESLPQIATRAERIVGKLESVSEKLQLVNLYELEQVISLLGNIAAEGVSANSVVVLDSIQTIYSTEIRGIPGGLAQIRYCAAKLVSVAKQLGITLIIVGHITKEGAIAGPKVLEHLVDVVLSFSGEENSGLRTLRASKNRFGSTDEVGLFLMEEKGLIDLANPGEYFLDQDKDLSSGQIGVTRTMVVEGVRPIIMEVQALVVPTTFSLPKRVSEGFSMSRLQLLTAVITKYLKLNLQQYDIYVNVARGFAIKDRGADLAVAMAIYSSLKGKPIQNNSLYFAELNLSGRMTNVPFQKKRIQEAERLGYKPVSAEHFRHISEVKDL